MTTTLASGRTTLEEVQEIQHHMYCWGLERTGDPGIAQKIVNCLHESFLLNLTPPHTNHFWPAVPGIRNWRYLCRRQIARLLGWSELIPEGHPDGITEQLNIFLRTKQWPAVNDVNDEGSSKGASRGPIVGQTGDATEPNSQALGQGQGSTRRRIGLTGRRPLRAAPITRRRGRGSHPYTRPCTNWREHMERGPSDDNAP